MYPGARSRTFHTRAAHFSANRHASAPPPLALALAQTLHMRAGAAAAACVCVCSVCKLIMFLPENQRASWKHAACSSSSSSSHRRGCTSSSSGSSSSIFIMINVLVDRGSQQRQRSAIKLKQAHRIALLRCLRAHACAECRRICLCASMRAGPTVRNYMHTIV